MKEALEFSAFMKKYAERYRRDLEESLAFLDWLYHHKPPLLKPTVEWQKSVYRIVYGGYNPLSVAGSLAAGGRFNVGGAQVSPLFPNFSMHACLYAASSLSCARKEVGELTAAIEAYELKPKDSLLLWDLCAIIENHLPYTDLREIIDTAPLAARWELQKVPKISQILAHHLRQLGGHGLIYPSTKDRRQTILAFFIKDDADAMERFSAHRLGFKGYRSEK
jgi:RES domain-containing protein